MPSLIARDVPPTEVRRISRLESIPRGNARPAGQGGARGARPERQSL